MGNIEASIQIDMREEAGCSVKTRGRWEEMEGGKRNGKRKN